MIMTKSLADELMNALACVAISANGGIALDENGEPTISPENLELINTYARNKFVEICNEWVAEMREEWVIENDEEDKTTKSLNPTCPHCGEELTLCTLPDVDCDENTVSVETEYECTKCGKAYIFRREGKVTEWDDPIIEEE